VVPGHDGVVVHQEALVAAVIDSLRSGDAARRVIAAPLTSEQPRFGTAEAERYLSQLAPIATFRTAFPINHARYTNIRIGASQFDGRVVAPGEELSFWSVFGGDPSRMGFVPAGAIINGISDNSVIGGGLCQVSTTLFNAVATAGYEIVERHSHSYLIERYPTGLDAAVFFPGADMRWKNDTAYPVLIRSAVTPTSVSFTIVSVPNGRKVTFSGPAQSRFVPVTPELKPDPGHVPGYSVSGRDVVRVRTVMAGDTVVHRDVFFSRYAPVWGGPAPQ
jgi:vancomycin resistance protein YoaR